MREPTNKNEILEFIFDCKKRDELVLGYIRQEAWTPAMAAMIVCGVRPLLQTQDEIPDTGLGLDNQELGTNSPRLRNARNLLANWKEEYEEDEQTPPESVSPDEYLIWCMESGYITDWLRLIGNLWSFPVEPGLSYHHGGISDKERITILPHPLMAALIETAQSPEVTASALQQAVAAPNPPAPLPQPTASGALCSSLPTVNLTNLKPLNQVIWRAIQEVGNPDETEAAWTTMIGFATAKPPLPPLRGYTRSTGIQWFNIERGAEENLSKAAFMRRHKRVLEQVQKKASERS